MQGAFPLRRGHLTPIYVAKGRQARAPALGCGVVITNAQIREVVSPCSYFFQGNKRRAQALKGCLPATDAMSSVSGVSNIDSIGEGHQLDDGFRLCQLRNSTKTSYCWLSLLELYCQLHTLVAVSAARINASAFADLGFMEHIKGGG